MTDIYIGIDPGLKGACVLYDPLTHILDPKEMPIVTGRRRKRVSGTLVAQFFADWAEQYGGVRNATIVIENVSSSPQMGVASAFSFGRGLGIVEGIAAIYADRMVYITPTKWKRRLQLTSSKGMSRQMAQDTFPKQANLFTRAKDDGVAEAALLAWGMAEGKFE